MMKVDLGISDCSHTLILQDGDKFYLTTEAGETGGRETHMMVEVRGGKIFFMGGADVVGMISGSGLKEKFVSGRDMLAALEDETPPQQNDGPPPAAPPTKKEGDPCPPSQPSE